MHRALPNILILLAMSITFGIFVLTGCSGGGSSDGTAVVAGGPANPAGEIPITVTGTVTQPSPAGAPDRLEAPLAGYLVKAISAVTAETLPGAEAITDANGNFVLEFRIPIKENRSIIILAKDRNDNTGATIMRSILPLVATDLQTLINQGMTTITLGTITPATEEAIKMVETGLGLAPGTLGKSAVALTHTQIVTEAMRGDRFVLVGVTLTIQGQVATIGAANPVVQSTDSLGAQANNSSNNVVLNGDGTLLAFDSKASNLVPVDGNGVADVFVKDTKNGKTKLVSVASNGEQGNNDSTYPIMTDNGKFIVFESKASNLVPNDTNAFTDIFVHDMNTGSTTRINIATDGTQANDESFAGAISANGRFVAFISLASNLVPNDTNESYDIFVHDRDVNGNGVLDEPGDTRTSLVSVDSQGRQADKLSISPAINADGHYIAFDSDASNLVDNDTNNSGDVFVHDMNTGKTIRVSMATDGTEGNGNSFFPSISDDGRYITFESDASNLVPGDTNDSTDIFLHDRDADGNGVFDEPGKVSTIRISVSSVGIQGDGNSHIGTNGFGGNGGISGDGRYVVFLSDATNLAPEGGNNATNVFIYDTRKATTAIISANTAGGQANDTCNQVSVSKSGKVVAFSSTASNLTSNDTNEVDDIFAVNLP